MNRAHARALRKNPTEWLEAEGFRVLRFWNHQVLRDVEAVKGTIREALL
jgi:very-short-patch-repair endonuclease